METQNQQIKELEELLSFFIPGRFPALEKMLSDMVQHQDGAFSRMAVEWDLDGECPF